MLSVELARELRDAGLPWQPARGDWAYLDGPRATVVVCDAMVVCGLPVLETDAGDHCLRSLDEAVWRPRLDQLLQALRERGEFVALDWSEGVWRCYGNASGVALAQGTTAEDACAGALLDALRAQAAPDGAADDELGRAKYPAGGRGSPLDRLACYAALLALRFGPAQRAPLDWAVTLLLTLFALGFALTAATLAVWLGLRLLGVPVVMPAGA
ncbi:MAG: hypothetical protein HY691_17565 [Chloroflexi bacterium]|nr:hypothetical protein [Chloroflexota bacterium]